MIELKNLTKIYHTRKEQVMAVDNLCLTIHKGDILALVGDNGCGKSTLAHLLMRLIAPTAGEILFDKKSITSYTNRHLATLMQIVFQDSLSSLNPRMCVEDLIDEPLTIWGRSRRADELLDLVGLSSTLKTRYPHELSGGQRQRVSIARAISLSPPFLILDEALSSLDLITQAQMTHLLKHLHQQLSLTYLFISHDLTLIRSFATRIAHMDRGAIVKIQSPSGPSGG